MASGYIGRFAPSPTGPLHLGSLFAALVSYLDAKANHGQWHLRIDDIDTGRVVEGADQLIINTLIAHGLQWDGDIVYQSHQYSHYRAALTQLQQQSLCFHCDCNRKRLGGKPYDGFCLDKQALVKQPFALRFKNDHNTDFTELFCQETRSAAPSYPIIWRKDGLCAYQLAVVVDDNQLGVTHVIRGADLFETTASQVQLYRALDLPLPSYGHFPVLVSQQQRKLSKQNHAQAIDDNSAEHNLKRCFDWLNLSYPAHENNVSRLMNIATEQWQRSMLPLQPIQTDEM